jgi:hypothetical protein
MTDNPMNISGGSPFPPASPSTPPAPGEQKPNVPPPPSEITIRTMQGDVKSMSEGGGSAPAPQPFAAPVVPQEEKLTIPGYTGPEEAIFTPENIPAQGAKPTVETEAKTGSSTKLIAVILGSLVLAAGLGFLGYYFIYPIFFPAEVPVVPTPPPVTETPPPAPEPVPPPAAITHKSFLITAADKVERITATGAMLTPESIRASLAAAAGDNLAAASLKEIYFANEQDEVMSFSGFAKTIVPNLAPIETQLAESFENDFLGFMYYDGTEVWVGYVAKLKEGANEILAKTAVSEIEKYADGLKNLFLKDPGAAAAAGFKDGIVNEKPGRYLSYAQAGASLNYLWVNNYLVISTNYKAAQEAVKRLTQ